jgi:hypothetical protein
MDEVVDRVMNTFGLMRNLDADYLAKARESLIAYFEKLNSAGRKDARELSIYGLAYLRERHDGPAARFTGC